MIVSTESNGLHTRRLILYFMMTGSSLFHLSLPYCDVLLFGSIADGDEPGSHKGKHLSSTEKITLVNIIKTLDTEYLLRDKGQSKDDETVEKRKILWAQIVPAFNEICGINCDVKKLKDTLIRIKKTRRWIAHSVLYDLVE